MKKTVTVNIGGIVFHIDEDAYEKLGSYLAHIKEHFSSDAGRDEILSDIENRIAEMFEQKLTGAKKVITIEDVSEIISQLGEPEQMADPEEDTGKKKKQRYDDDRTQKRLYRDPDDKYIAGVAGGLGAFLNLDPTWIRVAFVVFTFVYGFGPLLYFILWIVVPKARTTAERLEMRGEKVNVSNIEKSIREELYDLKDNLKEFSEETKQRFKKKEKSKTVREHNAQLAANFVNIFLKAAGIVLIIIAFSFLVALISGIYIFPMGLHLSHGLWHISVPEFLSVFLSSVQWVNLTMAAILLVVGIPVFWMLLVGIQLLFNIKTTSRYVGLFTFMLWLAALATLSVAAVSSARNFASHQENRTEHILTQSQWPNLYIMLDEAKIPAQYSGRTRNSNWNILWQERTEEIIGIPELRIKTATGNQAQLEIIKESRGFSPIEAGNNATSITYGFQQRDSLLILDPVFYFDKDTGWRNQKVKLELSLPEDKIAILQKNMRRNMRVHWSRSANVTEQ